MRFYTFLLTTLLNLSPLLSSSTGFYKATSDLNVRTGPGNDYPVAFVLKEGNIVQFVSEENNWYKIEFSRKTGYAYSKYLKPSENASSLEDTNIPCLIFIVAVFIVIWLFKGWVFDIKRRKRRDYYRNVYLKSDDWKRKRYVVLKRDNWQCVYCGARATQVHHKRYARKNIGKEPIEWLVSICKTCHERLHRDVG